MVEGSFCKLFMYILQMFSGERSSILISVPKSLLLVPETQRMIIIFVCCIKVFDFFTIRRIACLQFEYSSIEKIRPELDLYWPDIEIRLVQYSTVQYINIYFRNEPYSPWTHEWAWRSTASALYSTVQYSTVQYSTVQYSTVQYSTVQYSTVHKYIF